MLQVEYVPIQSIKPYERNAKLHPREQIEQIKASILEMGNGDPDEGFKDPIGVWHDEVVEGHGRLLAAQELGMEKVPIIRLDDLTDDQRRAYALIHNKLTMNSGFDLGMLDFELGELKIDMEPFGFTTEKIDWANVEEITEDTYEEPQHKMLECPKCHHVDRDIHFKAVES